MSARMALGAVLVALAAAHALLMLLPPVTWSHFLVRLAALVGLWPLLAAIPLYARHGVAFAPSQYVFGYSGPEVRVSRDLALDPARPDLLVDVYHPESDGPHPFVVVVHGGSWRSGDKGEAPQVSRALAGQGFVVFDLRYRLAPEHPFPAGITDVKCALGQIREQAQRFGIDPDRAALLGRSAGGHMALTAALTAGSAELPPSCAVEDRPVQRVVSIYAPTDLFEAWAHPFRPDVVESRPALTDFLGGPPELAPDRYALGSPVRHVGEQAPRTLLIHGSAERVVRLEHAEWMAAALRERGQPVEHVVVPWAEHGFDQRPGGIGEQLARGLVSRFLADL